MKMTKKMSEDTQYWYKRTIDQLTLTGKSQRTADTYAREICTGSVEIELLQVHC